MSVKERLIEFIKYLEIGQGAFEKEVGLSNGYVNNIRKSIQPDKLQRISLRYPQLNPGWLMSGEGKMLKGHIEFNIENATPCDIVAMGGEVYSSLLNKLIREKQLAPYALIEQKEQEIKELNREIGRLEEKLANSKKTDVQEEEIVTCAVAE